MNDTILAALVGGALASVPTIILAVVNIREERRRKLVEGAIQCASVEWKEAKDMAVVMSSRGRVVSLAPFSVYYLGSYLLLKSIDGSETESELKEKLTRVRKTISDIHKLYDEEK